MTTDQLFSWIINSGGSIAICSWIAEQIPAFGALEAKTKKWIFFVASFLISTIAYLTLTYVPTEYLKAAEPFVQILYVTFITVFVGDSFHKITK